MTKKKKHEASPQDFETLFRTEMARATPATFPNGRKREVPALAAVVIKLQVLSAAGEVWAVELLREYEKDYDLPPGVDLPGIIK